MTLFKDKLVNIHTNLMSVYNESKGYTSPILGAEREIVTKQLLTHILPPLYRVGSGAIVDEAGTQTGHIDAIIEQPFSLSFPIASDSNRLYVADAVGAAFEVKSDLNVQADDALTKVKEIKNIKRHEIQNGELYFDDTLRIPTFIIGFKGQKKQETIEKKFINPLDSTYPNGVLILESEIFYGRGSDGKWYMAKGKAESILAFISCVVESLKVVHSKDFKLHRYASHLKRA
ncbi:DUF6602 domain-containing protein [Vibrio parahaemolyticus]|uniref:DUF6602 domain-containing protein n=1 Tax=Vibrio parahaemolyticus TaxID=670 RepID=UPI00111DC203|nr:DUF6602 domain-containing protein [Vibrio parahaemolyticus]TPA03626.1 hypothetical protein DXE03_24770 [Vibrio parahaemolyticus]